MEVKVEKLITLGCLGALELVPLGYLGVLNGCCCLRALGASGYCWEPPIKLWRLLQPYTGLVTTLKGPIVDRGTPYWWRYEENKLSH